jgi:hypothetical protein
VALLLALGLCATFFALGFWSRRWSFVAATLMICAAVAAFLWINDGWYGAGWGDFGVAYNVIAGALVIIGVVVGVSVGRASDRAHEPSP